MAPAVAKVLCGLIVLAGVVATPLTAARKAALPFEPAPLLGTPAPPAQTDPPRAANPAAVFYRVYRVTAYCDRGLTAAGVPSGPGQCAAPADIPFGAEIYVPALGRTFLVTDRTAKRFRHNTVDIFLSDRRACLQFGCQYLECEIRLPTEPARYGSPGLRAAAAAARRARRP